MSKKLLSSLLAILVTHIFVSPSSVWADEPVCASALAGSGQQSTSISKVFRRLIRKGVPLQQNADYLDACQKGGTCGSISSINTMMILAEKQFGLFKNHKNEPGDEARLRDLHHKALGAMLAYIQEESGKLGTDGVNFTVLMEVYHEAFEYTFGEPAQEIHLKRTTSPHLITAALSDPNAMAILSVDTGYNSNRDMDTSHAIVATQVINARDSGITQESGIVSPYAVQISDPHNPNRLTSTSLYYSDGKVYVDGYGGGRSILIPTVHGLKSVKAGAINDAIIITTGHPINPKRFTGEDIKALYPLGKGLIKVNLTLVNNLVLKNVLLEKPLGHSSENHVYYRVPGLNGSARVLTSAIRNIELVNDDQ